MTTETQTLTDWLLERIGDDEVAAHNSKERAASGKTLGVPPSWLTGVADRVLAECAAKRALLALHYEMDGGAPETFPYVSEYDGRTVWPGCAVCDEGSPRRQYCDTVRILAAVYADAPGYREEWRP